MISKQGAMFRSGQSWTRLGSLRKGFVRSRLLARKMNQQDQAAKETTTRPSPPNSITRLHSYQTTERQSTTSITCPSHRATRGTQACISPLQASMKISRSLQMNSNHSAGESASRTTEKEVKSSAKKRKECISRGKRTS